jgi:hypothetical protein
MDQRHCVRWLRLHHHLTNSAFHPFQTFSEGLPSAADRKPIYSAVMYCLTDHQVRVDLDVCAFSGSTSWKIQRCGASCCIPELFC